MATTDRHRDRDRDLAAGLDAAFDELLIRADNQSGTVDEEDLAMLRRLRDGWRQSSPDPAFVRRLGANLASLHRPAAPNAPRGNAIRLTSAPSLPVPHGRTGEPWALPRPDRRPWLVAAALVVCAVLVATALFGRAGERRETIPAGAVASPPTENRAVVLMIDISGSMSYDPLGGESKIATVKAAATAVLGDLAPGDWFGVLVFNDQHSWTVPLAPLAGFNERKAAELAIEGITAEGGTEPYPALLVATEALVAATPAEKHLVILSDGKGRTGTLDQYRVAAEDAAANGITISTIAVGADADTTLMQSLAEIGGGQYHDAERTEEIPLGIEAILGTLAATPESVAMNGELPRTI